MERLFVDTGAWYAFFNRADPDHASVAEVLHGVPVMMPSKTRRSRAENDSSVVWNPDFLLFCVKFLRTAPAEFVDSRQAAR